MAPARLSSRLPSDAAAGIFGRIAVVLFRPALWQRALVALLLATGLVLGPIQPALAAMDYAKQVLIGADFRGADLQGVTFNLTNLRDATLDSAVFDGTDLRNARLDDAFAFNTKFSNVLIEGADFTNVPLRGDALKALCAIASGTNPSSGRATRDTLGCG